MKGILVIFALLIILPVTASAKAGEKGSNGTTSPSSFTHEQSAKILKGDVCKASLSKCNDDLSCLFQVSVAQKHCSTR